MDGRGDTLGERIDSEGTDDVYRIFFDAVVEGGIAPLVEAAYSLLGQPIVVADNSAGLVMQYPDDEMDIPVWNELRNEGAIKYENYLHAVEDYRKLSMPRNEPIVVRDLQLYDGKMIAVAFWERDELTGYVYMMCGQHEPTDGDLRVARILAKALQPEMARLFASGKEQDEQLILACEKGDGSSRANKAALTSLKKRYGGGYRLIYVETRLKNSPGILPRARRSINSGVYDATAVDFDGGVVVLLYGLMPGVATVEQVTRMLSHFQVVGAISTPFDDIGKVYDHLVQARATLAAGRIIDAERQFFSYEDAVPLQPFAVCSEQADMAVFVHPSVRKMLDYDSAHGTAFVDTLTMYLANQMKKTQAANELGIHMNTLTYRLERMEELFGIDLSDHQLMGEIQVSLLACRFIDS